MNFIQKSVMVKDVKLSYWDNINIQANNTIILLSPGAADGSHFKNYIKYFPSNVRLIAPDFIGRGGSDEVKKFNSIELVTDYTYQFIKSLKLNNIICLGVSFGTMIINELMKMDNKKLIKKVILIAPGEYIDKKYRKLIEIIAKPALRYENVRNLYKYLIDHYSSYFKGLPDKNLKSITEQLISTVRYKLEFNKPTDIPAIVVTLKNDKIVDKDSIIKIKNFYINHEVIEVNIDHVVNMETIEEIQVDLIPKLINKLDL